MQVRKQTSKQSTVPWIWNPGQISPEVQNRGITDPTKNLMFSNFFKNKMNAKLTHHCKREVEIIFIDDVKKRFAFAEFS